MGETDNTSGRFLLDAGAGYVDVGWASPDGMTFTMETEPEPGRSFATNETVILRCTMRVPPGYYRLPPAPLMVSALTAAMLPPELLQSGLVTEHPDWHPARPAAIDLRQAGEEVRRRVLEDMIPPHLLTGFLR